MKDREEATINKKENVRRNKRKKERQKQKKREKKKKERKKERKRERKKEREKRKKTPTRGLEKEEKDTFYLAQRLGVRAPYDNNRLGRLDDA